VNRLEPTLGATIRWMWKKGESIMGALEATGHSNIYKAGAGMGREHVKK